jgi:cobalamin biosynthesis Mg chelatase CobN
VKNLTEDDIRTFIREVINRFCERIQNQEFCANHLDGLEERILAIVIKLLEDGGFILGFPDEEGGHVKRAGSFGSLVEMAVSDPDATETYSVEGSSTTGSQQTTTGSQTGSHTTTGSQTGSHTTTGSQTGAHTTTGEATTEIAAASDASIVAVSMFVFALVALLL